MTSCPTPSRPPRIVTAFPAGLLFLIVAAFHALALAPEELTWYHQTPFGDEVRFDAAAYGNGTFVAVGDPGIIATSADGLSWSKASSGTTNVLRDVSFGNGIFVVSGRGGTILTSSDGQSWSVQNPPIGGPIDAVSFGNGQFYAAAKGQPFIKSVDGKNWQTLGSISSQYHVRTIAIAANGVAVGGNRHIQGSSANKFIAFSTDFGQSWEEKYYPGGIEWKGFRVAYGNGYYLGVSEDVRALRSTDGDQWDQVGNNGLNNRTLFFAEELSRFVAVGRAGKISISEDGTSWSTGDVMTTDGLVAGTYSESRFVLVGMGGQLITSERINSGSEIRTASFQAIPYSIEFEPAIVDGGSSTVYLTTFDGESGTPLGLTVGGQSIFSGEIKPESIEPLSSTFVSDYVQTADDALGSYGSMRIDLSGGDQSGNNIPDVLEQDIGGDWQVSAEVTENFDITGETAPANLEMTLTRSSGEISGTYSGSYTTEGETFPFEGNFRLNPKSGEIQYDLTTQEVFVSLTDGEGEQASGSTSYNQISEDQIEIQAFDIVEEDGDTFHVNDLRLNRSGNIFTGISRLDDGNLGTSWGDFIADHVTLNDPNDSDEDGIPDLSNPTPVEIVAPQIVSQPEDRTVESGEDATFIVEASGTEPLSYKWQKEGEEIAGGDTPQLTLVEASKSDEGSYTVVVSNQAGSVTSESATLKVLQELEITQQPQDAEANLGETVTFMVEAQGEGELQYQWRFEGARIIGATSSELVLDNLTDEDFGVYTVTVSDSRGSLQSQPAVLSKFVDSDGDGLSDAFESGVGRYEIIQGAFTWVEAREDAVSRKGHLATILSKDEWSAIENVLNIPNNYSDSAMVWLGGTDEIQEESWQWATEEEWAYENWVDGQPGPRSDQTVFARDFLAINIDSGHPDYSKWSHLENEGPQRLIGYILEQGSYSDPRNEDTDSDGLSDGKEVEEFGTNPLDTDSDNDLFSDLQEVQHGSDPLGRGSYPDIDSDGDGLADAYEYGVSRYEIIFGGPRLTWQEAKVEANSRGLHLVTITSQAEWETLLRLMMKKLKGRRFWLGGEKVDNGKWQWVTDEPWSFTVWGTGQPNDISSNGENFLRLRGGRKVPDDSVIPVRAWWNDEQDSNSGNYIFEEGFFTKPDNPDTDGDGVRDGEELSAGTSPVNPDSFPPNLVPDLTLDKAVLIEVKGKGSGIWIIQRSTDLHEWRSWKPLDLENDSRLILDPSTADNEMIYYRAVKQE